MNDMSTGSMTLPGPEDGGFIPLSCVEPPSSDFSTPCDKVITALASAQSEITPPVRTKHVKVTMKNGGTYAYDYAPLETILAAVVKPLAKHGLILSQQIDGHNAVEIVLMHGSGQWMRTVIPLMRKGEGPAFQDFAGALTAARRVGIQALLSISAEDDDDGNANVGNEVEDRHWDPRIEAEQSQLHPFIRMARGATSVRHGCDLLKAWPSRASEMAKLRRTDPDTWSDIVTEIAKGLDATMGGVVSTAWRSALLAETVEQEAAIRDKWHGEWDATLERFRSAEPSAFGDLMRHMHERRAEIEAAARRVAGGEPDPDATADAGPTKRDAAIEAQQAQGEGFLRLIIDAQGDPASDEFTDPEAWAKAFATIRGKTPVADREALDDHNMEGISQATEMSIGADVILREVFETDAAERAEDVDLAEIAEAPQSLDIPVVEIPRTRGNSIDIARYVEALGSVISTLASPDDIARFIDLNRSVYTGDNVPLVVQTRVLKALAGRKRALGIPLPSEE
jgi:hypothetical protein